MTVRLRTWTAVLAIVAVVVAACSSGTTEPSATSGAAEPADYSGRGPYAVGVLELALDPDHPVLVFYPVDPAGVAEGSEPYTYSGGDIFEPAIADILPGALAGEVAPPDTWVGLPASPDGPFPVVLHSHGASGAYRFAGLHNSHTASWGNVVVAVDHPERGLVAAIASIGGGGDDGPVDRFLDTDQLLAGLDLVVAEGETAGSPIEGAVDGDRVAGEGHSAGGSASGAAAYDPRISAWIAQASGGAADPGVDLDPYLSEATAEGPASFDREAYRAENPAPPVPAMLLAAEGDTVVELDGVVATYDWLTTTPKVLGVIADSGHAVFVDPCVPIRDTGGLSAFVAALGIDPNSVGLIRLGEDGCLPEDVDPAAVQAVVDHMTVAFLQSVFGDAAVGLASLDAAYLDSLFPGLLERVDVQR